MIDVSFPFEILRSFVSGQTAIDIPHLIINGMEETEPFLSCYGYDWNVPLHREEIEKLRIASIDFINEELLGPDDSPMPPEVYNEKDVRLLLLWASDQQHELRRWACAVLRVAHTYAHCESYFNDHFGPIIREQIFSRFESHLFTEGETTFLGHDARIPLTSFEAKRSKSTRSVVMKLLHKAENVASDIFDRFGVRFITEERFDALLVVKFLRAHNIVMFANVKPSRSRNTLIDLDWLETAINEETDPTSPEAWRRLVELTRETPYPAPPEPSYNPYSGAEYHSIQFTCRQMIRGTDEAGRPFRFFFPFEIQILDEESFQRSRSGYAAHDLYKARQRDAVRARVLGSLID